MRFRLEADHVFDKYGVVSKGEEIGDGTRYPFKDRKDNTDLVPSSAMTPLDQEAKDAWNKMAEEKKNWGRPFDEVLSIYEGESDAPSKEYARSEGPEPEAEADPDLKDKSLGKFHPSVRRQL